MSEVKPPTSASLRAAEGLIEGWDSADDLDVDLPRIIAVAIDASRRAALGQAAEIADGVAAKYHTSGPIHAGNIVEHSVAAAAREIESAIRALMEGE